jgi:hypothetical protein
LKVVIHDTHSDQGAAERESPDQRLPHPTLHFRLAAWQIFQRHLDPLAPPRPLRKSQRH